MTGGASGALLGADAPWRERVLFATAAGWDAAGCAALPAACAALRDAPQLVGAHAPAFTDVTTTAGVGDTSRPAIDEDREARSAIAIDWIGSVRRRASSDNLNAHKGGQCGRQIFNLRHQ